jgi:hypothetical protein
MWHLYSKNSPSPSAIAKHFPAHKTHSMQKLVWPGGGGWCASAGEFNMQCNGGRRFASKKLEPINWMRQQLKAQDINLTNNPTSAMHQIRSARALTQDNE